jgi:hypothetical protein
MGRCGARFVLDVFCWDGRPDAPEAILGAIASQVGDVK